MRCERCGFHNLPGATACLSCRSPLGAARRTMTAEAASPPRRSAWLKWADAWLIPVRLNPSDHRWIAVRPVAAGLLGLIPGLAQAARGRWRSAVGFFGAWTATMVACVMTFAAWPYGFFVGATVGLHAASALHPYRSALVALALRERLQIAAGAALVLAGFVYYPVDRLARDEYQPVQATVSLPGAGIENGDVVLTRRYRHPETPGAGDTVLVEYPGFPGLQIERVVGLPGDRIQVRAGTLLRNGLRVPPTSGPLVADTLADGFDFQVPTNRLFVWPSVFAANNPAYAGIVSMASVPGDRLRGRVWMVYHPWKRRRVLDAH